jgi:hypothetical protein
MMRKNTQAKKKKLQNKEVEELKNKCAAVASATVRVKKTSHYPAADAYQSTAV